MRKIVEVLDTETPQVMIEAKVVEVQESYSKEIGLTNGFSFGYDPIGTKGGVPTAVGEAVQNGQDGGPGFSFSSAPTSSAATLFGLSVKRFGRVTDLQFDLRMLRTNQKVRL